MSLVIGVSIEPGLATLTTAGTSTKVFPSLSLTTTVTFLEPDVVVSTGVLYSNLVPSGNNFGSTLSLASGCLFSSLAGTSCSTPSATTTFAGTSTIESPSLSLTTTVTSLIPGVFEISFSLYSGFASASLGNTDGSTDLFTSGSFPTATY